MSQAIEKFRQMGSDELRAQDQDLHDRLFRLKFQMAMGQSESVKTIRQLRRDVARVKTLLRERALKGES